MMHSPVLMVCDIPLVHFLCYFLQFSFHTLLLVCGASAVGDEFLAVLT